MPRHAAVGRRIIRCKWVDDERFGDAVRGDFVRSRCVAMELRAWGAREDNAANTPPVLITRLLLALAAAAPADQMMHVGTADVSVAFFHAEMDEELYAEPPRGCAAPGCI